MSKTSDEDWSIISSSSDMEDERSNSGDEIETPSASVPGSTIQAITTTSIDSPLTEYAHNHSYVDDSDDLLAAESSIQTLRLPKTLSTPASLNTSQMVSRGTSANLGLQVPPQRSEEKPVKRAIEFYESLTANTFKLHESIKHQSDKLYHQLTKHQTIEDELDQFETEGTPLSTIKTQTTTDGIQYQYPASQVMSKWLESNSEYLIYFAVFTVASVVSLIKVYTTLTYKEPVPKYPNIWDTIDTFFYDQQVSTSWFFKSSKTKQLKLAKYYDELRIGDMMFLAKNSATQWSEVVVSTASCWLKNADELRKQFITQEKASAVWCEAHKLSNLVTVQSIELSNNLQAKVNKVSVAVDFSSKINTVAEMSEKLYEQYIKNFGRQVGSSLNYLWNDSQRTSAKIIKETLSALKPLSTKVTESSLVHESIEWSRGQIQFITKTALEIWGSR
ncbi:hypothetical protein PSN45_003322 [Yamadazyma tenuis]|uniref:Uncharacterized protein n=1 Tax=Candida tenuis (strain ATCC 10573 / BCRC 21748 / CBS 615 / JCM 9827 / NBRC 10315 / NRRL Y-1498 / VKM Y-70) TaxID=590646 RepID=G3AYK5_CANTC|nr:uncharacterized protein CANTEDRAFT_133299 [Yamadazyma tenuis ATCC 10573]EGV65874.1 hypothetical protein CANTEDRAFT_133299 [Yamadazyma tenuis ATCC 10573]WEJ95795.1 hypothetical protein PSN45_003322 [Yamadazyma tenuis]